MTRKVSRNGLQCVDDGGRRQVSIKCLQVLQKKKSKAGLKTNLAESSQVSLATL